MWSVLADGFRIAGQRIAGRFSDFPSNLIIFTSLSCQISYNCGGFPV